MYRSIWKKPLGVERSCEDILGKHSAYSQYVSFLPCEGRENESAITITLTCRIDTKSACLYVQRCSELMRIQSFATIKQLKPRRQQHRYNGRQYIFINGHFCFWSRDMEECRTWKKTEKDSRIYKFPVCSSKTTLCFW